MNNKLFVYGTLMNDVESNIARFLRDNSQFLGIGYAKGTLYDLGFYPGFVPNEKLDSRVTGHVFELKNAAQTLPVLDKYEAVGEQFSNYEEYVRQEVAIELHRPAASAEKVLCWVYVYNQNPSMRKVIPSGNYLEYLRNNDDYQRFLERV